VPEHSLFTGCLIEGLTHGFQRGSGRAITGSELGLYLQRRVETYPGSQQSPDFGTFAFDDRGEMVLPFVTATLEDATEVTSRQHQDRAHRILSDAYDRWHRHECNERRLLDLDTTLEILTEVDPATAAPDWVRFLDQSTARNIEEHPEHVATALEFMRRTADLEAPSVRFTRLLHHPSRQIRLGTVRLVREFGQPVAAEAFSARVVIEKDPDILRIMTSYLWETGVTPSSSAAEAILSGRPNWMTAAWALTSTGGRPAALLLGDDSDFTHDLRRTITASGLQVIEDSDELLWFHDRLNSRLLQIFQVIIIVRGNNYFRNDDNRNYDALAEYVRRGGLLFATPWVAWETVRRPFAATLPFFYLRNSHNEGVTLQACPAQSQLAEQLFTEPFALETSYEELAPLPATTTLLHSDRGIPLYGFHRIGEGECHYLNICQHHCSRTIPSPFQTTAFSRAMERVWRWIAARSLRCDDHTVAGDAPSGNPPTQGG